MRRFSLPNWGMILFLFFVAIHFSGCGSTIIELAKHVRVIFSEEKQEASIQVFLAPGTELDFEGDIPLTWEGINYGSLAFFGATSTEPGSILVRFNLSEYQGALPVQFGITRQLPNGIPMVVIIERPLYFIKLPHQHGFTPVIYFRIDPHVELGGAILVDATYLVVPEKLAITQVFTTEHALPVACATFFGPRLRPPVPGGLFFYADLTRIQYGNEPTVSIDHRGLAGLRSFDVMLEAEE